MKQLLYKVYDLEQNCWIENSKGFDSWSMAPQGYIELWENTCTKEFVHEGLSGHLIKYNNDRFDILLSANKKDDHGNDLYDGDLVRYQVYPKRKTKSPSNILCVTWKDHVWGWTLNYPGDVRCEPGFLLPAECKLEKIGHKHTHPDLMKEVE